ncbi:MAG: HAD family phosphatase, partial [Anaerolineae bacterium]|nr:HAD family phosphatase [Anaerolineae bacterium]
AYDLGDLNPQVYKQGVDKRVKELLAEHTEPQPGAPELVAYVAQRNIPRAVASNSSVSVIEATLANQPWAQDLPLRCSAEFVAHAKPAPVIYLHTAAELGIAPEYCVAIEDSVNGAKAVAAAGMTCLAVPDRSHASPADFHAITPYIFTTLWDVLEFLRPRLPR